MAQKAGQENKPNKKARPKVGEDERVRKSLHYSNVEGMVTSSSWSILSSYIVPFALALKATAMQIGLLTALQDFSQTLSQIPGAKLTEYYRRKSIWLFARVMSRLVFGIPLIILAIMAATSSPSQTSIYMLMVFVIFINFFAALSTPAWSSLIGDLVSTNIRGRYFGRRNMLLGLAGIVTVVVSGYIVSIYGFWLAFTLFVVLGLLSIPFFLKMHEPSHKRVFHYKHRFEFHPMRWATSLRVNRRLAILTFYMVLMMFAVQVASPFYAVYMLKDLSINYTTFAVLIMLGALARIISFRHWGMLNDKFGSRKIFLVCATFGIFTPFLWLFVNGPLAVAVVNIFDGFIWAGFDLVAFNYLLDITPADRRPQYVANYNFFVGLGAVCGALAGGLMAAYFDSISLFALTGLQLLFLTSFLLRALLLAILPHVSEPDVLHSRVVPVRYVFWQALAAEPTRGIKGAIHYTFHYPYEIEKEFKKNIKKLEYKVKMMSV